MLLLDLDHFKQVNDTYGHLAGDNVLSEFARRIERQLRAGDVAGRWGGEEFLVILPHTTLQGAADVGEKIRAAIAAHPFGAAAGGTYVTVSGGCAEAPRRAPRGSCTGPTAVSTGPRTTAATGSRPRNR